MEHASRTFVDRPAATPARRDFYRRLDAVNAAPLWDVLAAIVPASPAPQAQPALWRYAELRPLLMEAGGLLTPAEAERRVLVLENPGLRGQSKATGSLYAGLQLLLPGEIARCHRHAASALRVVLEGTGAYTAVDGERTPMHPGDFILTPSWSYHDHGNPGDSPVVWLDGLDLPIVNLLDASFAEHYPGEVQPPVVPDGDSQARYGANLLPVDYEPSRTAASPLVRYPYARTRETLETLVRSGPLHPVHGVKMRFVNPATGGWPLPTIGACMQLLPAGFHGEPSRSTDSTVYAVMEGTGRTSIAGRWVAWGPRDVFVVPSWAPVFHDAVETAVLFSMSDRPVQQALGLWREQVGVAGPGR